ncbi:flagellar protein FlaG [Legionella cardiaca]|uniref:Flagellar protein FlaG n=1 Tax=Legionella cardiaca TaxID=1071983 RepID=A0ABY8AUA4_9GAMM|nr:flagellar protein FlaG [Legionella cardiaca]WED44153.1 flagellar protein FlaG [Legionella cardiaca]
MNIELPNKSNTVSFDSTNKVSNEPIEFSKETTAPNPVITADTKYNVDEATGILQAIVTDKLSDEIIRKIPADEYLQLLSLIDEMISGSIDERV